MKPSPEIFSFHLAESDSLTAMREMFLSTTSASIAGLKHAETMITMQLGLPVFQPSRYRTSEMAFFARWESENALVNFLQNDPLGVVLDKGWHVRLKFYRRWGFISELDDLPENTSNSHPDSPVVGITLARLKLSETIRFLKWGKPVEKLVRDHPGQTFAIAAMRPLNTLSTFSIWRSEVDMIQMVQGTSAVHGGTLHSEAMVEQMKKSFHHEFTTMRFHPLGEYGSWMNRSNYLSPV